MNKREIVLCTVGLPFVFMAVLLLAVFMLFFVDPTEEAFLEDYGDY